jgi:uncharacterized membrane protein
MDQKITNAILVIVGIILVLTGIPQIMNQPGIFDYISSIVGVLLVIIGLYGFKAGKVI